MMRRVALIALLLFAGCSFFSKSKSRFYSLDRIVPAAPTSTAHGLPVGIDSFQLPPDVDRKEVVVRQADRKLEVRSAEQWSASFNDLTLHTLAFDLAGRLPTGMVILPGEAKPAAMRTIDVAFEDLAAGPDRNVVLDARWVLHQAGQPDVAHHERVMIEIPSFDSANIATGVSQALAALADRIAAQL